MNRSEMINFNNIKNIENFSEIITRLSKNIELSETEKEYILACSILFCKFYEEDNRATSYLEVAYYIILKYSLNYDDYLPLYDFSINFGFFPIAKSIKLNKLLNEEHIDSFIYESKIEKYKYNNIFETYEQKKVRKEIIDNCYNKISYIAPTSFGKSSLIVEHISKNKDINKKIAIILPTKSLLMQTYRMVRSSSLDYRVILHDEMYLGEESFIAVFTQERTIRLLEKKQVKFDILYIDEAHNLFDRSSRSILLSRAIRKAKNINKNVKILYLSPLINDSNNLKLEVDETIQEQRIHFNIKEPEIFELTKNNEVFLYNRFINDYIFVKKVEKKFDYIFENLMKKNMFYIRSPKKIEKFANKLYGVCSDIENNDIEKVIQILKEYVHEEFYSINLLKRGIIYIHGQMPDIIKEYLEKQYREIKSIKYIIANTVVLEGINLPIETLFILNTYSLHQKELNNLIGRVNRLQDIFGLSKNNLRKLLPKIHFINNKDFNGLNGNMRNKINLLRHKSFSDKIKNPILNSFNIEKLKKEDRIKIEKVIEYENYINIESKNEKEKLKKYMIKENINDLYSDFDFSFELIYKNWIKLKRKFNSSEFKISEIIFKVFIENVEEIKNYEFKRLERKKARDFYEGHIFYSHIYSLKENIIEMYKFFNRKKEEDIPLIYIGKSFGEIAWPSENYNENLRKNYVDLRRKNKKQLINIAITKLELEKKFIDFTFNKFVNLFYDFEIIDEDTYNLYIYGTTDRKKIDLSKLGLSINLINKLESDNQLINITVDNNNNLIGNEKFEKFKNSVNDFYKFEIERVLI